MTIQEFERKEARIIAGAIREIAANANEPKDRPHNYSEAEINMHLASLTEVVEGCMKRAANH